MGIIEASKLVFDYITRDDEEKEQIKSLQDMGVNVFLQMLYTDQAIPVSQVLLYKYRIQSLCLSLRFR